MLRDLRIVDKEITYVILGPATEERQDIGHRLAPVTKKVERILEDWQNKLL